MTGPKGGIVQGRLSPDKTHWVSQTPLQAASRYRVTSTAVDAEGLKNGYESGFRTRALTPRRADLPQLRAAPGPDRRVSGCR